MTVKFWIRNKADEMSYESFKLGIHHIGYYIRSEEANTLALRDAETNNEIIEYTVDLGNVCEER